jgi:hypothetical protein
MNNINQRFGEKCQWDASLLPMSVAWTIKNNDNLISHSLFRDMEDIELFICNWLDRMFADAQQIFNNHQQYYDSLNLPDTVIKKLHGTENNKYGIAIKVLGYNSQRFDANIFISYVSSPKLHFKNNMISSGTQYKSISITHDDYPYELQFLDLLSFLAGGDLDVNAKAFSNYNERMKGYFPYELLTTDNYIEELNKTELFEYKDFYSSLRCSNITEKEYEMYKNEAVKYSSRLDYLLYYNEQDTKIMIPIIDFLIKSFSLDNVDMLRNYSLSSCASQMRYASCYEDFNIDGDYSSTTQTSYILSKEEFKFKIESYNEQDKKAKRSITNNITINDFPHFKTLLESSKCYLCNEGFSRSNKPTLDRINNNIGHTKSNVVPCCAYCNSYKSNNDERLAKLFIQLRKYAIKYDRPFNLSEGDEEEYDLIRNGITGGLSNVHNRINIRGVSTIKRLVYENDEVKIIDTGNIISHGMGLDKNSLYPSSFSSVAHKFNPYTSGIMYMPGRRKCKITNFDEAMEIIYDKNELFIVSLKGHIDKKYYNEVINFPPIIRNVDIKTDKETIGEVMYEYMKNNGIPTDKTERKLTQLLSTNDKFMTFSSYYLWFLIDTCHFIIDDIKVMYVYTKHTAFKNFVVKNMNRRQEAKLNKDEARDTFYKLVLNGSYGYDIMNEENFTKSSICDRNKTFLRQLSPYFSSTRKLNDNQYQVQMVPQTYECKTPIIQGFFTLDNAKFWYLNFIYNFLYKCIDMNKIHFIEGDTDSMYWAIAGNLDEDYKQGFKHVIKDENFYNDNIYEFAPNSFYSTNNSNPKFSSKLDEMKFNKKILGLTIEKQFESMIALAPKCYTCFNADETQATRSKGVNTRQNRLCHTDYISVLDSKNTKAGTNINLQLHNGIMSKISSDKNILTATHTKYKVSNDFSTCTPLYV